MNDYLNDHLAGAIGALELLGDLIERSEDAEFANFCTQLRAEVHQDKEELCALMKLLGLRESRLKQAGAWTAEKATRIILKLGGEDENGSGRLFALEGLCLGICGKRALWTALREAFAANGGKLPWDFDRMIQRAENQWALTEAERLAAARRALTSGSQ